MKKVLAIFGIGSLFFLMLLATKSANALAITFDYTYDTNGFFDPSAHPNRRASLEQVGAFFERSIVDKLDAIVPGGNNTFNAIIQNPSTGSNISIPALSVPSDTLIVYVGARDLGGSIGLGGPGGFTASSVEPSFFDIVRGRGELGALSSPATDFGPWGGGISFDSSASWYFDEDPSTVESFAGMNDFYSVAVHELSHVFGFGTAPSWDAQVKGGFFTGIKSSEIFGRDVPLADNSHWANATSGHVRGSVQEAAMDPFLQVGTRKYMTDLDIAALDDVGWITYLSRLSDPLRLNLHINGPTTLRVPGGSFFRAPDFRTPIPYSFTAELVNVAPYDLQINDLTFKLFEDDSFFDDLLLTVNQSFREFNIPANSSSSFTTDIAYVFPATLNNAASDIPFFPEDYLEMYAIGDIHYSDPFGNGRAVFRVAEPSTVFLMFPGLLWLLGANYVTVNLSRRLKLGPRS